MHLQSTEDESHPIYHQSVTQLTTVKLGFNRIRTMTCVFSDFRCSLLLLVLFVASQALAKPGNNVNSTPVSSSATEHCSSVYNSFYAAPNKKIETILQEMKTQLTHVEDDINILKGNKTLEKGKYRSDNVNLVGEGRSPRRPGKHAEHWNLTTDFNRRITLWSISHIIHFAWILNFTT